MTSVWALAALWLGLALIASAACNSGGDEAPCNNPDGGALPADGGSPADATSPDGGTPPADAASDTSEAQSPAPNPEVTYKDFTNAANYASFDTAAFGGTGGGYEGAAFDGRYIYLIPGGGQAVARYDTRASFGAAASWSTFQVTTVDANAWGFRGGAFDGRYIYLVPYVINATTLGGVAARYDTHADFATASSWSTFDITTVDAAATGFIGCTFDGRYLELAPYGQDGSPSGVTARYDTWGDFTAAGSWVTFNTASLGNPDQGYVGATFDGRYAYYSPYGYGAGEPGTHVTRFDTWGNFTDSAAWTAFDTSQIGATVVGFFGASFDGRYAYFVPYTGNNYSGGNVARYDTLGDFANTSSWSSFDTAALGVAPAGAVFDGRYMYLVPNASSANSTTGGSGLLARLDTQTSFTDTASWSTFDLTTVNPHAAWFFGGAFDGEHVYLVPGDNSVAIQFDAKTPPSMPSAYHGSFF